MHVDLSDDSFQELVSSSRKLVVKATASWCRVCIPIAPHVEALSHTYTDITFATLDVDECPDASQYFQIEAMPTLVFLFKGNEIGRVKGANKTKIDELCSKLDQMGQPSE